jgi:hypothetical protein
MLFSRLLNYTKSAAQKVLQSYCFFDICNNSVCFSIFLQKFMRQGKAIIFENNARMVCICPFFVVTLRAEILTTQILESITQQPFILERNFL